MVSVYGNSGSTTYESTNGTSAIGAETPIVMEGADGPLYKMTAVVVVDGGYIVSEQLSIADPKGGTGKESIVYSHYASSPAVHIPRVPG